jgi:hypothetical protein
MIYYAAGNKLHKSSLGEKEKSEQAYALRGYSICIGKWAFIYERGCHKEFLH